MTDFHLSTDQDGVATITWDAAGRSMNLMSTDGLLELGRLVNDAFADSSVRGIIITSGKDSFSGGMDLSGFAEMKRIGEEQSPAAVFEMVMKIHGLMRLLETGGQKAGGSAGRKPVVAALPGTAAGIGFEIPLACHRIICADNPGAEFGLPEIKVGLFPAAGGTTRMIRKLGLVEGGPWLFRGSLANARKAQAAGLVDEVVEPGRLLERAREWILNASEDELVKPWDRKKFRIPGGTPYDRAGFESFVGAPVMTNSKGFGVYPAVKACLSAIYEGALVPFDTALRIEARWFTWLLMQPSTEAMIRTVFTDRKLLAKGMRRPAGVARSKIEKVGVIGAGMMGAGITHAAASAGIKVAMLDSEQERADAGKQRIATILEDQEKRGRQPAGSSNAVLDRISAGTSVSDLADCDLVIEAVFEDPKVKAKVLSEAAAAAGPECVIASNTSTLPIDGLARAVGGSGNFLGMHFFSPVHRMMLVEIIKGSATTDPAVARAVDFVQMIRKVPIIVNDARFFYANRCIIPYINEGVRMVGEGIAPALVDNSAKLIGMPIGPLQLIDETSIDLAAHIAAATRAALGDDYQEDGADRVIDFLVAEGRLGRRVGAGFYDYDTKGRRSGFWSGLSGKFPPCDPQPAAEEVKNRLMLIQVLEAIRALEDGVLVDVREGDVGAVLGWGLAVWAGGPFSWLDVVGPNHALETCRELENRHGSRFKAPDLLVQKAGSGERFTARMT